MSFPPPPFQKKIVIYVSMICEETLLVNSPTYINVVINLNVCFVGDPPCELPHSQAVGAM